MSLVLEPEIGVPYSPDVPYIDLKERADAACKTAEMLGEHGLDLSDDAESRENAAKLVTAYAEDPEKTSKKVTNKRAATLTPPTLIQTSRILNEFGHQVVQNAVQVRHMVTNKLIEESENPDPRIRIRALELLGKISDVGLFAEKSEITITHQTSDEIRDKLRNKLSRLLDSEDEPEDAVIIEGDVIDVDAELGVFDDD
jgi:hypothetical protein